MLAFLLFSQAAFGQDWPQWRGPNANGVSHATGLPVRWSPSENIAWKVKLPGRGMSTPIIWGDRIFVTSQIGFGKVESRSARYEGPVLSDDDPVTFILQCFRQDGGKLLWERRIPAEKPLPSVHAFHNLSTPSPVTDGERVYAWFGTGQIIALTLDGQAVWSRNLGKDYSPSTCSGAMAARRSFTTITSFCFAITIPPLTCSRWIGVPGKNCGK
jgi:outer membrane protein assembly factor BamB